MYLADSNETWEQVAILTWRPIRRRSIFGFASVQLPSGMLCSDVAILVDKLGARAARALIDQYSATITGSKGSPNHFSVIEFASGEAPRRASDEIANPFLAAHPEAIP